jgi:hypothetical protein
LRVEEKTMDVAGIAEGIKRVIRNELDDCERAIRGKDDDRALRELDDAVTKLKRLADQLR